MSEAFLAEIRIVGFNFPPQGWAACDGQLIAISQNTALFSLLGTNYGGDGRTNFALPNLQGSAPMHAGQGPGLSDYSVGETGGASAVTVLTNQMPTHSHTLSGQNPLPQVGGKDQIATTSSPTGALFAEPAVNPKFAGLYAPAPPTTTAHPAAVSVTGGSQPHNNMQPFLTLLFVIALQGIFPSRN